MAAESDPTDLSREAALQKVRELASESRNIVLIPHARLRGAQRMINRLMVERCLQKGTITEGPYRALRTGYWRMTFSRRAAGEEMTCVVEIDWPDRLLVVTVY